MSHSTDVSDFQPTSLSHLIGQRNVIRQVEVALDACQQDCKRFDHAMLVGPPGLGKSALAAVIAQEMAADFHEVLGQSLNSVADLNGLLLAARDKDIVFVDEAHEMKRMYQTALYLALDKQCVFIKGANLSPQGFPLGRFSLLLATTDEFCLLQPLRDRMKLVLRYEFYSDDELGQIIHHRGRALGWNIEDALVPQIAQRSKGTPRLALRLLQSCHRVCRSLGESSITADHLQKACGLEQIDDLGLGRNEQQYLRILAQGPNRLNVLASRLALPGRTVSQVIEAFLIRAGLVAKDHQGIRQLTARGREHLLGNRPKSA
ncbi:MAG: Holliday junction DNA helicase RuvB C-terminal domain-containing protein [Thermoguttaceae bacterium]|jgi:Holliday junction DNA helicase RuvB